MHQLMSGHRDTGCWMFGKFDFAIKFYNKMVAILIIPNLDNQEKL